MRPGMGVLLGGRIESRSAEMSADCLGCCGSDAGTTVPGTTWRGEKLVTDTLPEITLLILGSVLSACARSVGRLFLRADVRAVLADPSKLEGVVMVYAACTVCTEPRDKATRTFAAETPALDPSELLKILTKASITEALLRRAAKSTLFTVMSPVT
jgi:hypothetical protein